MPQHFCPGMWTFFCGGSEKSRFQRLHKEQFQNFLELYVRGRISCYFNKFLILLGISIEVREYARFQLKYLQWNPDFSNLLITRTKSRLFLSPLSDTVILVTPDFSKYPIFRGNFRFLLRFEKFGFNCKFGIIIRSLDVRIGLRFERVCTCFRALCNFFRAIRSPPPQVQRCPYAYDCFPSVLATSVKIFPYRPPARLIRAKYKPLQAVYITFSSPGY